MFSVVNIQNLKMGKKTENFKLKLWLSYKEHKIISVYWDKQNFQVNNFTYN